ncbi:hypothetical protein MKX03_022206 [Papaver bracteatum]|nr:hypothetical protein MKX03_022206 [Papaver bracteatum]
MGRPPCCDKVLGIKKGPWTPEEDLILASYIKEKGPLNWRSVPTNTGLLICSKSCKLRWSNHLRPGIKRGNFTELEEKKIITLQSLWGNKNLEYHHLIHQDSSLNKFISSIVTSSITSWSSSTTTTYALSTGNISRLLEGWMKTSPNKLKDSSTHKLKTTQAEKEVLPDGSDDDNHSTRNSNLDDDDNLLINKVEVQETCNRDDYLISNEADYLDSLLTFENISNMACLEQKSSSDSATIDGSTSEAPKEPQITTTPTEDRGDMITDSNHQGLIEDDQNQRPFSLLEKWLLDEATEQVLEGDQMEISPTF